MPRDPAPTTGGWVYILASAPYGTLYVGVTADLPRRMFEHWEGVEFTKRYGWKIDLIERDNPRWDDLCGRLNE